MSVIIENKAKDKVKVKGLMLNSNYYNTKK